MPFLDPNIDNNGRWSVCKVKLLPYKNSCRVNIILIVVFWLVNTSSSNNKTNHDM